MVYVQHGESLEPVFEDHYHWHLAGKSNIKNYGLLNDNAAINDFNHLSKEEIWCKMASSYPKVAQIPLRELLCFPSTYLCECSFSTMSFMKSKYRARLDLAADLRVANAKTEPNSELLSSQMQQQRSH